MSDDKLETQRTSGGWPPTPGGNDEAQMPRMPDLLRRERLRSDLMRWSEAYLAEQIARAVARGRRTQ